jgi:transcriptional accessory protein Tex/SPT6
MPLKRVSSHQLLAIRRGEKEGFLKVGIEINDDRTLDNIARIVVKGNGEASQLVEEAAEDSFGIGWEEAEVRTFEQAGIMTYNKGLVISLPDGTEFQLTIVQSR